MDRLKLEQLAKLIVDMRNQRYALNEQEKGIRKEILDMLKADNHTRFTFGEYIVEIKKKYIKTLKKSIQLPDDNFDIKVIDLIYIKRKQDLELIGNKFVVKKKVADDER